MNYAFEIDVLSFSRWCGPLGCELLDYSPQPVKTITVVSKRDLRNDQEQQNREEKFASHSGARMLAAVRWQRARNFSGNSNNRDSYR